MIDKFVLNHILGCVQLACASHKCSNWRKSDSSQLKLDLQPPAWYTVVTRCLHVRAIYVVHVCLAHVIIIWSKLNQFHMIPVNSGKALLCKLFSFCAVRWSRELERTQCICFFVSVWRDAIVHLPRPWMGKTVLLTLCFSYHIKQNVSASILIVLYWEFSTKISMKLHYIESLKTWNTHSHAPSSGKSPIVHHRIIIYCEYSFQF